LMGDAPASVPVASIHAGQTTVDIKLDPAPQQSGNDASWAGALSIISHECSVPVAELTGNTSFADLSVDSLLSLLCASRFREELGLAHESTIFPDYPSVKTLQVFWNGGEAAPPGYIPALHDAVLNSMLFILFVC
jgi:hypothetical protein